MAYSAPSSADLIDRYPAFASTSTDTIDLWLTEAAEECANWSADTRARAEMAYAAHRMAELGVVKDAAAMGVSSFKSGDFSATISDSVSARTGFDSTVYGREFKMLARRNFAGPRPAWMPPNA